MHTHTHVCVLSASVGCFGYFFSRWEKWVTHHWYCLNIFYTQRKRAAQLSHFTLWTQHGQNDWCHQTSHQHFISLNWETLELPRADPAFRMTKTLLKIKDLWVVLLLLSLPTLTLQHLPSGLLLLVSASTYLTDNMIRWPVLVTWFLRQIHCRHLFEMWLPSHRSNNFILLFYLV